MTEDEKVSLLIDALLRFDPDYPGLFTTSPEFHYNVTSIARLAPALLKSIREQADSAEDLRRQMRFEESWRDYLPDWKKP